MQCLSNGKKRCQGKTCSHCRRLYLAQEAHGDTGLFCKLLLSHSSLLSQVAYARILNELIEKIVVHEKERGEDGTVTQQVDIYYKFIGYIDPAVMLNEAISPSDSSGNTKPIAIIV